MAEQARHAGEESTDELGVGKAFSELVGKLMSDPFKLAEMSLRLWQEYFSLWANNLLKATGAEPQTIAEPGKFANRFKSQVAQNKLVVDYVQQSHLVAAP